ncbi:MAG: hypothetical protein HY202_07030 [Nitrospirae bacterium]|nr:hypothetical protein [Nitrospirota bacterium]
MIKLPVKVIFFDAAETLFRTRGSVGDIYLQIAKKYGSKAAKEAVDNAFFNAFKKKPPPVFLPGKQSEREGGAPSELALGGECRHEKVTTSHERHRDSEVAGDSVPQRTSAFPLSPAERLEIEKQWWYEVV